MKKCLQCGKDFKNKRDTAKFCKVACRVTWNRKNKDKPKVLNPEQMMSIIYNKILDTLDARNNISVPAETNFAKGLDFYIGNPKEDVQKARLKRNYSNYQELRLECTTAEEWQELKEEILNADNLTRQEKISLTI